MSLFFLTIHILYNSSNSLCWELYILIILIQIEESKDSGKSMNGFRAFNVSSNCSMFHNIWCCLLWSLSSSYIHLPRGVTGIILPFSSRSNCLSYSSQHGSIQPWFPSLCMCSFPVGHFFFSHYCMNDKNKQDWNNQYLW